MNGSWISKFIFKNRFNLLVQVEVDMVAQVDMLLTWIDKYISPRGAEAARVQDLGGRSQHAVECGANDRPGTVKTSKWQKATGGRLDMGPHSDKGEGARV